MNIYMPLHLLVLQFPELGKLVFLDKLGEELNSALGAVATGGYLLANLTSFVDNCAASSLLDRLK
jgi:hypothetical protein